MNESRNHTATVEWGYEANFLSLSSFLIEETLTHICMVCNAPRHLSTNQRALRSGEMSKPASIFGRFGNDTSRRMHAAFAMAIN